MTTDAIGDAEAEFEVLIEPLVEAGLRLAYAMLGDRQEAEDATQEAITGAWRKRSQLRDAALVRPWFLAIVANRCRNVRRTRWFRTLRLPEIFRAAPPVPPVEDRIDLERALTRLPMDDRKALFLHFYLDLPLSEVALALGVSAAAAKGRIYRACRRLRPDLRKEDI